MGTELTKQELENLKKEIDQEKLKAMLLKTKIKIYNLEIEAKQKGVI
jgi:hypothetical protein